MRSSYWFGYLEDYDEFLLYSWEDETILRVEKTFLNTFFSISPNRSPQYIRHFLRSVVNYLLFGILNFFMYLLEFR